MEYVLLRLLRKFILSGKILSLLVKFIPYYHPSTNESNPKIIIDKYRKYLESRNYKLKNKIVLDIGSGSTNSIGYGLINEGVKNVILFEPFARFDEQLDAKIKDKILTDTEWDSSRLKRINNLNLVKNSFDLIISHSVLEHVYDPESLFTDLNSLLNDQGVMLHIADFRDHFFKYPYNFLKYSKFVWNTFLNPGDLPRWRKTDYLNVFKKVGISCEVIDESFIEEEFQKVYNSIHSDFEKENPDTKISYCVFLLKKL